ncbi:MAG: endolytic transglycosylase MltG [Candidatus Woesebacteria bacterium]|jgi:UPF0755 protein
MADIKFKQSQEDSNSAGQSASRSTGRPKKLLPVSAESLKKHLKLKWLIVAFVIVAILAVSGVGGFFYWYNDALKPVSTQQNQIKITVESGETAKTIAAELQEKGIIKNAWAFEHYVQQSGVLNDLMAGTYLLSPSQSVRDIVQWLVEGKVDQFNLTILPGKTLEEIKQALVADGYLASEVDAAFVKNYDHPLLKTKPADVNLEGYVYPDTYQISSDTTVEQLLTMAFDTFYEQIQDLDLESKLSDRGFALHQGITLASIVEQEANSVQDRKQVAQVFELRLANGMVLGSDVTYMYAAEIEGVEPYITIASPYNTRINEGLPPGAISNFTIDALEAVAEPADGDYLYFVAGDDGNVYFGRTEQDHQNNIDNYCTILCQ